MIKHIPLKLYPLRWHSWWTVLYILRLWRWMGDGTINHRQTHSKVRGVVTGQHHSWITRKWPQSVSWFVLHVPLHSLWWRSSVAEIHGGWPLTFSLFLLIFTRDLVSSDTWNSELSHTMYVIYLEIYRVFSSEILNYDFIKSRVQSRQFPHFRHAVVCSLSRHFSHSRMYRNSIH